MPSSPQKKFVFSLISGAIVALILLLLLFLVYQKQNSSPPAIEDSLTYSTQEEKSDLANKGAPNPAPLQAKLSGEAETGQYEEASPLQNKPVSLCKKVSNSLAEFVSQLDQKDYILAYDLNESLPEHLNKIIIKLLNNPPVIISESENLLSLLKNTAHFYRVLGHKDVSLIKDILMYEGESMENILADLYQWSIISENCQDESFKLSPTPLKKLYEYSCFFLNTLGGQSYLFRRESRSRVLIQYYSLLVLDDAAKKNLNKYNLDPTSILKQTFEDIQDAHFLINKNQYLDKLDTLARSQTTIPK